MLLRQSEPADADSYINAAVRSHSREPSPDMARVDPLDDVFGSESDSGGDSSPVFGGGDSSPVFGGGDSSPVFGEDDDPAIQIIDPARAAREPQHMHHPSDMHRLQQEHTTAGYRDGITVAKASSIQTGFDEGFGLGATIGLKVGYLLGVLEGISGALAKTKSPSADASRSEAASKLLSDGRADLSLQSVFAGEFWNADGTWTYEVEGGQGSQGSQGGGKGDDEDVLFSHVADAHPLVRKWTAIVEAEMRKWGLEEQLPLLQRRDEEEDLGSVSRMKDTAKATAKATGQIKGEAKAPSAALSW